MNGWMELLAMNLLRATLVTCVAALVAMVFLAVLHIRSPKLHRLTWVLVLLQGWLVATYDWQIEVDRPTERAVVATKAEMSLTSTPTGQMEAMLPVAESTKPFKFITFAWRVSLFAWSLGGFALVSIGFARYVRLFVSGRPGEVLIEPNWLAEWKQVCDSSSLRGRVEVRITHTLGPLLCWVPRVFLVLVPRKLWSQLAVRDRLAILRHELAHCERGDLWKNLAVRMLALPQWFNPLVWLAVRRFEEAGEWACDEQVARATSEASTSYASTLVRVADFATQVPSVAVGVTGGELTRRVQRLLHLPNKEDREMRGIILPILLVVIGLLQSIRIERVEAEEPAEETPAPRTVAEDTIPPQSKGYYDKLVYIIEPPDILRINTVKVAPKKTYKIERFDRLKVRVETADNQPAPIENFPFEESYLGVDTEGNINLGSDFGRIHVFGITIDDAQETLRGLLARKHPGSKVSVSLAYAAGSQQIDGEHLVAPDGCVDLGSFGSVYLNGLTNAEAKTRIETRLSKFLVNPEVTVDVWAFNSKKYYIITELWDGDKVVAMPITGNDTVLDAIAAFGGIGPSAKVWIERPAAEGRGSKQILPVSFLEITTKGDISTNHQLWPGDRVRIEYPEQAAAIPPTAEIVKEHSISPPPSRIATTTAVEIQRWGVQITDDTAELLVPTNIEHKFVMATITSLQKAGTDKFTLRLLDPNDETDITTSAVSINITDGGAEIKVTADIISHKFTESLISQLEDAGITKIEFTVTPPQ